MQTLPAGRPTVPFLQEFLILAMKSTACRFVRNPSESVDVSQARFYHFEVVVVNVDAACYCRLSDTLAYRLKAFIGQSVGRSVGPADPSKSYDEVGSFI